MTGLEAVTFLGYTCIYTRYGAGSRDALAERYVGIAHPL
jgi:hypothetical protein